MRVLTMLYSQQQYVLSYVFLYLIPKFYIFVNDFY